MSAPDLRLVMGHPGRFQAVFDGRVPVQGVRLNTSLIPYNDLFRIVPQADDFDVAELSTTAYLYGLSSGRDWIALPIFSGWAFAAHTDTVCHRDAAIDSPADLKGRRVGVPEYPVAAILWIRDALESGYGVRPQDIQWFEQRQAAQSHYRLMGYTAPAGVSVTVMEKGRTLDDALIAGELDAVIRYLPGKPGQRSLRVLSEHPSVKWLFPDRKAAGLDYCRQQGFFEPIHLMIMKRSLAERYPRLPRQLVDAFKEALAYSDDPNWVVPGSYTLSEAEQRLAGGASFCPVGVNANRKAINRLLDLAHAQGFTRGQAPLRVEDVFHETTLAD